MNLRLYPVFKDSDRKVAGYRPVWDTRVTLPEVFRSPSTGKWTCTGLDPYFESITDAVLAGARKVHYAVSVGKRRPKPQPQLEDLALTFVIASSYSDAARRMIIDDMEVERLYWEAHLEATNPIKLTVREKAIAPSDSSEREPV